MWSAGSEVEFYGRTHIGTLATVQSSNGLFEASPQTMKSHGNRPIPVRFEKGGM
jgi:hypothetical protein